MKVWSLLASEPSNVSGSQSLVGWAIGAASALGAAKVLASSAMAAARLPPVSPGSSPGSGTTTEGVWMEGLSGGAGALPSACARVSGRFEGESISLVILLHAEPGTGRVRSGSDRDLARRTDLASAGRSAALTRPSCPVFQQPEDCTDVGGHRDHTVSEDGDGARVRQRRRYFITMLIVYGTVVSLLY